MENLQRQQAARLALEEKLRQAETEKDLRSMVESQIHQQALAFRHYQAAMRGALTAGVANLSSGVTLPHMEARRADEDGNSSRLGSDDKERDEEGDDMNDQELMGEEEEGEDDVGLNHYQHLHSSLQGAGLPPKSAPLHLMARVPASFASARRAESPTAQSQHHEWTYEEQFKQVRQADLLNTSPSANLLTLFQLCISSRGSSSFNLTLCNSFQFVMVLQNQKLFLDGFLSFFVVFCSSLFLRHWT